jgi:hypothetical protein
MTLLQLLSNIPRSRCEYTINISHSNEYSYTDLGVKGNTTAISGYVKSDCGLYVPINTRYKLVYITTDCKRHHVMILQ